MITMNNKPLTGSFANSLNEIGGLIVPATASVTDFFGAIFFLVLI
jgi:hypothetical protein